MRFQLRVKPSLLKRLEFEARKTYPYETIALLHGYRVQSGDTIQVKVTHVGRAYIIRAKQAIDHVYFELDCRAYANPSWLGLWHSHPEGPSQPSTVDIEEAAAAAKVVGYLVIAVTSIRMLYTGFICEHSFILIDGNGLPLDKVSIANRLC